MTNPSEFQNLAFNPLKVPKGFSVIKRYSPHLNFFNDYELTDEMVRFILLMYSPGSRLRKIQDQMERVLEGLALSGIEYDKSKMEFPLEVKEFISGHNDHFNRAVFRYLSIIKGKDYAIIEAMQSSREQIVSRVMAGETKAIKELDEYEKEITKRQEQLLGYVPHEKWLINLDDYIIEEKLDLSVEALAKLRKEGKEIFPEVSPFNYGRK